jgi:transcriptional regulator with XRE-family HTH domain
MIAPYLVERVRTFLLEGKVSFRKVARKTGLSRPSISRIAEGRRRDRFLRTLDECRRSEDSLIPLVPPRRCPICGKLVYPPCRACKLEKFLRENPRVTFRRKPDEPLPPLRLELEPPEQWRYRHVRRRRILFERQLERLVNFLPRDVGWDKH